ncbi:MAG TPA: type II CAAX endopeptidase family protein [Longimicrobium sp.]|nr:type II CAAX endopeptidase family protein [Longimicrobium sp.]
MLATVWAGLAGAWLQIRAVPALPCALVAGALFCAVHLRTGAQRAHVRLRRPDVPAWAVAGAIAALMSLKVSVEALLPAGASRPGDDPVRAWLASGGGWAPVVATLVLLVPLVEETVFRGLMLQWLERRYGATAAVVGSAVVFAVGHLNPAGLPSLLLGGLVLGYAFHASRSLWVPVLLHASANATVALSVAGVPFGARAATVLVVPSAAALVWLGFRFRPAGQGAGAAPAADLVPAS